MSKINAILVTVTQGSTHSMTEIARASGLPLSTAHRLTSELASSRLLERTADGRYRPGLALRMISTTGTGGSTLSERAPAVLEDLSAVTRARVRLGMLHGPNISYIEKQPGYCPVTSFTPAATLPVHPTAVGRALLAFALPHAVESIILRGFHPYTTRTITSPDRFRRALAVTRLTKVALTRGELEPGIGGVAMPVFGPGGEVVAAIELTIAELDHDLHPIIGPLTIASRSLSRDIAGGGHPN